MCCAGYFSYKWAEVLSADAFSAFEEVGLENEDKVRETGARFRDTVLAMGGGRDASKVFVDFRGRAPTADALLRSGLYRPDPLPFLLSFPTVLPQWFHHKSPSVACSQCLLACDAQFSSCGVRFSFLVVPST